MATPATTPGARSSRTPDRPSGDGAVRPALIYDGECARCRGWADRVRRWDRSGTIDLVAAQDPETLRRFPGITQDRLAEAVHYVDEHGVAWAGADAIERLLARWPVARGLRSLWAIPGWRRLAARAYDWIARGRHLS